MLRKICLVLTCFIWASMSIFIVWIVQKFISSKPPSRKIITTDINAIHVTLVKYLVLVHCMGVSVRTLYGPLPLLAVFLVNQVMSLLATSILGASNVSAFLQVALVFDPRYGFILIFYCM